MATILIIDDNETVREGVSAVARKLGHEVLTSPSGDEGVRLLGSRELHLVVTDLKMDGLDGMGVLRATLERSPETAVVIMTGFATVETAVEAIKLGAFDFIEKPFSTGRIRAKIEKALEWQALRETNARLAETTKVLSGARDVELVEEDRGFDRLVGQSAAMRDLFGKVKKVAASEANVHIFGESGTGKELIAEAIHRHSRRADGPLIKVNCGALTDSLLESELFGHEKGAFTGAIKRRLGRFELADRGTIFLDEIGDISPAMQVRLLRVLQERTFERVGGEGPIHVDVRIISATNKDLSAEVEERRFREDLYYRLHIVPLNLPPLRERTDDIVPLARHFVQKLHKRTNPSVTRISAEAEEQLTRYHYPGNVRELENIVEQALVFASPPAIQPDDLPPQVSGAEPRLEGLPMPAGNLGLTEVLESIERQMILKAYESSAGVKTECARLLKIKTSALYYKLEKYGIGTIAGRPSAGPEDD